MARPENPEIADLTIQEKRKYYARLYQNKNRDAYRQYQRAYQLKMTHNPNHKAEVKQRRIDELQMLIAKAKEAAESLINQYQTELNILQDTTNG